MQSKSVQVIDSGFEEAVNDYIDRIIDVEKEDFQEGIEPFSLHAAKLKERISESMHAFQKMYNSGYQLLVKELAPTPDPFSKQILNDPQLFTSFLAQGGSLYQILGFSTDTLKKFHEASMNLIKKKSFEEAKNGFYFLITIAPAVIENWLGLALTHAECGEFSTACEVAEQAIQLQPDNPDCYLLLMRIYLQKHEIANALKVCTRGAAYALENKNEEWANELGSILEEAKNYIK